MFGPVGFNRFFFENIDKEEQHSNISSVLHLSVNSNLSGKHACAVHVDVEVSISYFNVYRMKTSQQTV